MTCPAVTGWPLVCAFCRYRQNQQVGRTTLRLSDDARRGWEVLAHRGGVSLTALIEAIGRRLDEGRASPLPDQVLDEARRIDAERRSRR